MTAAFPVYAGKDLRPDAFVRKHNLASLLIGAYIICLPVQFEIEGMGFRLAPSDLFLILYLIFLALSLTALRPRVWTGWHIAVLLSFATATLVAQLRNGELSRYVILNKDIGVLFLFASYAALTAESRTWADIRHFLRLFVFSVTFVNTFALVSFFNFVPWLGSNIFHLPYIGRLSGLLVDPNAYGGLLAVAFSIHAITYFSSTPLVRGLLGLFIVISLLAGIFYTYSRSSWISVTAMITALCILRPKVASLFISIIAAGLVIVIGTADQSSLDHMIYMSSRPDQVESRLDIFSHAFPQFLSSPLLGVGLGSFSEDYGIIIHNTPIWFLTEFGLLGFISVSGLYIMYILLGVRAYRRNLPSERPLILGLILAHIVILGLSMGIEAFYQRHWWLVTSMLAATATMSTSCTNDQPCLKPLHTW